MGNEDGQIPASASNDRQDTPGKICEHCGSAIDASDWFPVTSKRASDGSLRLYYFCDEECEQNWKEANHE